MSMRFIIIICMLFSAACTQQAATEDDTTPASVRPPLAVDTVSVIFGGFQQEILSNGRITSDRMADMRFRVPCVLEKICVKNGDRVSKGQLIAKVDDRDQLQNIRKAETALDEAKLRLYDMIIEHSGRIGDTTSVDKEKLASLKVRSGYAQVYAAWQEAHLQLEYTKLYSPENGIAGNVTLRSNNLISSSDLVCTIVGDDSYEVEFPVLENEIMALKEGFPVEIIPFYADSVTITGTISELNPIVDKNGLISVKARINGRQHLYVGMNVKIIVKKCYHNKLIVPKSAVVLRSGKQVVFTFENNLAKWNYVETEMENSKQFSIKEGLSKGAVVIYTGNLNLAHDAPVEIRK